jgi:hypothetical protein
MVKEKFKKDKDSLLSTAYQKFEKSFTELDLSIVNDWTITHSLIYICKKYEQKFKVKFILSYKDSPSKSPEYKLTARLWMMLGATKGNGELVKDYIDWFYKNYNGKTKFISLGALAKPKLISDFKNVKKIGKIDRSTPISNRMSIIVKAFPETEYVKTWGDLAFLKQIVETENDYPVNYKLMLEALESDGVDLQNINKIT